MAITTTTSIEKKRAFNETEHHYPTWLFDPEKDKLVNIYIDSEGGDEPVAVCINGFTVLIPVGEWVEVPAPVQDVLMQSRRIIEESKKKNKNFAAGKEKIG